MLTVIACLTDKKFVRNHATLKLSLSAIRFILVWRQIQRDYTLSFEQFPGAFLFFCSNKSLSVSHVSAIFKVTYRSKVALEGSDAFQFKRSRPV